MSTSEVKKELKAIKRNLLEEKHAKELEILNNKKDLRKAKRKIRQIDEALKKI